MLLNKRTMLNILGILIDSKLSFKQHITSITKKISRAIGLLYKLRHCLQKSFNNDVTV